MADGETYPMPEHGWTCFHCGETFTTPGQARNHFGFDPSCDPACRIKLGEERGLVRQLREVERKYQDLLERICDEQFAVAREFYGLGSKHALELRGAEEQGYERGLADGGRRSKASASATGRLGQQIYDLRVGRDLTIRQLAGKLGVSAPTVWAWEHGHACPLKDRIPSIAAALGVSPATLRGGRG